MSIIEAGGLVKQYGDVRALDGFDLEVKPGQIVGLIGPNGSGKTTALNAMLGLNHVDSGSLSVLGREPMSQRAEMMQDVAYIADTGILPSWMKVSDLLNYVAAIHPKFDIDRAQERLSHTEIRQNKRVRVLSKGMHVQLHLAIVLAIDAPLLVLDEPTLGLDILYRQQFYDAVLNDYFNEERSILVTTHEVREIENILTDVVFIHRGRAVLTTSMSDIAKNFVKLTANETVSLPAEPLTVRKSLAGTEYIFDGVSREALAEHFAGSGALSTPNLAELFVAVVEPKQGGNQ
ncbi:MAG: ATP-binding cassette domain-containing protein [Pseudomonadales bacterium]|nr:ATP-binding cassette domain-containing protein [Pseudomonadales bacterium]